MKTTKEGRALRRAYVRAHKEFRKDPLLQANAVLAVPIPQRPGQLERNVHDGGYRVVPAQAMAVPAAPVMPPPSHYPMPLGGMPSWPLPQCVVPMLQQQQQQLQQLQQQVQMHQLQQQVQQMQQQMNQAPYGTRVPPALPPLAMPSAMPPTVRCAGNLATPVLAQPLLHNCPSSQPDAHSASTLSTVAPAPRAPSPSGAARPSQTAMIVRPSSSFGVAGGSEVGDFPENRETHESFSELGDYFLQEHATKVSM